MLSPDDIMAIKGVCASRVLDALAQPYRRCSRGYHLRSPWRTDAKASVSYIKTSSGLWHWTDFGTGQGGSHIDFVIKVLQMSYSSALYYLYSLYESSTISDKYMRQNTFSFSMPHKAQSVSCWEVNSVTDLDEPDMVKLKNYRHISSFPPSVIQKINFRHQQKKFSKECLCTPTLNGGYEVFTAEPSGVRGSFKTAIGKKDISLYVRTQKVIVAESMIDAISANHLIGNKDTSLVSLNTVHNKNVFLEYMSRNRGVFKYVLLALDNDMAGDTTREYLVPLLLKLEFEVYVLRYKYKDPNLQLIHSPESYSCEHIL